MIAKAVVMARGLGTRLRAAESGAHLDAAQQAVAAQGIKALMPVAGGHALLDYALARLADAGFTQVCLVIGPEHHVIKEHVATLRLRRLRVTFAEQREPRGTADAVLAAESFAAGEPFVVVNADNLYPVDALRRARALTTHGLPAFSARTLVTEGNLRPERVGRFPLVEFDAAGRLTGLVERDRTPGPGNGADEFISMNCWGFTPSIFAACRAVAPSPRNELEITEAARVALQRREPFAAWPVREPVLDLTSRADVAGLAARLADVEVDL